MPFKKGQGGRPKGAPNKVGRDVRALFAQLGGPDGEVYAKQLHAIAAGQHDDVHARLKALTLIAGYVWGKPTEHVQLEGEGGGPVVIRFVDA